jgi:hypothetical protein
MIEAAAQAAWTTDRAHPFAAGVIAALRFRNIILPAPAMVERAAIAGRARERGPLFAAIGSSDILLSQPKQDGRTISKDI